MNLKVVPAAFIKTYAKFKIRSWTYTPGIDSVLIDFTQNQDIGVSPEATQANYIRTLPLPDNQPGFL